VAAHSLNYLGCALMDLGDIDGADYLRRSAQMAHSIHHHEYAQRAYTNLVEGLYRMGRFDELDEPVERGLAHARDYAFPSHEYNIEAHRCMLLTLRGKYDEAERGLRRLMEVKDPGVLATFSLSALGRLLARRGNPEAAALLEAAWETAVITDSVQSIAYAGIALVESAWLRNDHAAAIKHAELPLERTNTKGAERYHGELLRFLARCGQDVETFEGCPEEYAFGLAGDFEGAARVWRTIGAPYERALELADSGDESMMLEGLAVLDDLGAVAAAGVVRRKLRVMGIRRVPRRPRPGSRTHPAGLTNRQMEVLSLLASGSTNAEIAETLVVSTRTVDHHVSAILQKLNVETRRQASREAAKLGVSAGRPSG
jgi:ATP/maltotriose-dependent transcriptional regulator MalT